MEIKKETLQMQEQTVRTGSNVMVEGDIILPDGKPDMREVLLADAEAFTQSEEIRGGKLHISGAVQFHMLYTPEEADCPLSSYSILLPFTDTLDIPNEDAKYAVRVTTEHIGFSRINSRKLSAKIIVSLQVRGYETKSIAPVISVSDPTIPCHMEEHHIYLPLCEAKEDIVFSDLLTVPSQLPDIDDILKTTASVRDSDCKVMNGKVLVRGTLMLSTLYIAANEESSLEQVVHEIPFSEMIEAEGVDENCRASVMFSVKNVTASPRGDLNGDTKIISMDATVGVTIKGSSSTRLTMVDDCYSTSGILECDRQNTVLYAPVLEESSSFTETQKAALPNGKKASKILSVSAKPIMRECTPDGNTLHMKGALVTFLLYQDQEGAVCSCVTESSFNRTKSVSGQRLTADCFACPEGVEAQMMGDGTVEIHVTVLYHLQALKSTDVSYITSCTLQESSVSNKHSPGIVIYFVQEGDTLWSVAKKYGIAPEKIQSANTLEGDRLAKGQKLFIPSRV